MGYCQIIKTKGQQKCLFTHPASLHFWLPQPSNDGSLPSSSGRTLCCQALWHWGSDMCSADPANESEM